MREEHILLSRDGPDCNVLKLKPPMVFTKENADAFASTLDRILKEIREKPELWMSTELKQTKPIIKESSKSKESRLFQKPVKKNNIKSI